MDWVSTCLALMYKWNGDNYEISDSRGISLFIVVGKVW